MENKILTNESKVMEVLHRMQENLSHSDMIKTCFGILSVLSKDKSNKVLIIKNGIEIILNSMSANMEKVEIQEGGCDIMWSIVFNDASAKEAIAKYTGSSVLVRALKRHGKSYEFLKSACGAISNICQLRENQDSFTAHGGLPPLIGAIQTHFNNEQLLPYLFDAIASLIVNNEENSKIISQLGYIPSVLGVLNKYKSATDISKSGCHSLAILSDVKGQASKISYAGGVQTILSLLDIHSSFIALHRVAAVVLLRMLQEATHVAREIPAYEGVRILLKSLEQGGAQNDTVAAVVHMLYVVTNPSNPAASTIESQLWVQSPLSTQASYIVPSQNKFGDTSLLGLLKVMDEYYNRRDIIRTVCRFINNIGNFPGVVNVFDKHFFLDRMLTCVSAHNDSRDIIECSSSVAKAIGRRTRPSLHNHSPDIIQGLMIIFNNKSSDDEIAAACCDIIDNHIRKYKGGAILDSHMNGDGSIHLKSVDRCGSDIILPSGKNWMEESLIIITNIAQRLRIALASNVSASNPQSIAITANSSLLGSTVRTMSSSGWTKHSPKLILGLIAASRAIFTDSIRKVYNVLSDAILAFHSLYSVLINSTHILKNTDLIKRLEDFLNEYGSRQPAARSSSNSASEFDPPRLLENTDKSFVATNVTSRTIQKHRLQTSNSSNRVYSSTPTTPRSDQFGVSSLVAAGFQSDLRSASVTNASSKQISVETKSVAEFSRPEQSIIESSSRYHTNLITKESNSTIKETSHNKDIGIAGIKAKAFPLLGPLLENWPSQLERLCPPATPSIAQKPVSPMSQSPNYSGLTYTYSQSSLTPSERMYLVYESKSAAGLGLYSKILNPPSPYVIPVDDRKNTFENSLEFGSEFESGNLHLAIQRDEEEYDLFLRPDVHTLGHTQWFYFSVSNTHRVNCQTASIKFNIVNLTKPDSLFNLGMRPVIYSSIDAATKGVGWVRAGREISYVAKTSSSSSQLFYTLSFTIDFHNKNDTVLIAYTYPYTMTDYRRHIDEILASPGASDRIRQQPLCKTIAGQTCDLLVITDFTQDKDRIGWGPFSCQVDENGIALTVGSLRKREMTLKATKSLRPAIFLSARVHPGETPASWMMKGILEFLTGSSPEANLLRQLFVIFVVPVLNPDGVLYGNNRCSLAGVDLNRQWKSPDKTLHPTIFHLKALMANQRRMREVYMYIDLHGHSRKYNVFMYGCDPPDNPNGTNGKKKAAVTTMQAAAKQQVRSFPRALALHNLGRKYVCFSDCSFQVKKGREATARVVVARELGVCYSYTLEATFCGSNYGPLKYCHLNISHLLEIGASLCSTILEFSLRDPAIKDYFGPNISSKIAGSGISSKESFIDKENGFSGAGGTIVDVNDGLLTVNEEADDESQSSDDENSLDGKDTNNVLVDSISTMANASKKKTIRITTKKSSRSNKKSSKKDSAPKEFPNAIVASDERYSLDIDNFRNSSKSKSSEVTESVDIKSPTTSSPNNKILSPDSSRPGYLQMKQQAVKDSSSLTSLNSTGKVNLLRGIQGSGLFSLKPLTQNSQSITDPYSTISYHRTQGGPSNASSLTIRRGSTQLSDKIQSSSVADSGKLSTPRLSPRSAPTSPGAKSYLSFQSSYSPRKSDAEASTMNMFSAMGLHSISKMDPNSTKSASNSKV